VTFGFIRTSTHMIRAQVKWWPGNVSVGGTHIHHLVWGILLLLICGYIAVAIAPDSPWREVVAVFFGIGTGLTLDEFALWLNLKDVYWSEKGRRSIDAVIAAGSISGIVLVGFHAWLDVGTDVADGVVAGVGALGLIAIAVALVNAAKEKFGMALVSIIVWPLGLIGAARLARPHSLWAHFFYSDEKRERAAQRFVEPHEKTPAEHGDTATATAADQSAGSP
jgi:lysyl-tRNA synthetase class 2